MRHVWTATSTALILVLAWTTDAVGSGRSATPTDIVVAADAEGTQERAALIAAIALLPENPTRIAVMDVAGARPGVRERLLKLDAFTVKDNGVIYVVRQSELLRGARTGAAVYRAILATVIWHEMAHLANADERAARQAEEELWTRLLRDGITDPTTGLRYLEALKNRPADQLLALGPPVRGAPATAMARASRRLPEAAPTLRVWVYVTGALGPADRDAARQIADDLLAAAGVAIEWRMCDAAEACSRATDPSPDVTLILTSAMRPTCGTAALERNGLSATVLISVPCATDVVLDVIRSPAGRSNPLLSTLTTPHLLGAAMAHELGHVLGLPHAPDGLMRARLDIDGMLALRRGELGFTRREVAVMRASTMWQGLLAAGPAEPVRKP